MRHSVFAFFIFLAFSNSCFGNISELISARGQATSELFINSHCVVLDEQLNINLRPVGEKKNALVNAKYEFSSDTAYTKLSLVFVANNMESSSFNILLDGKVIHGDTIALDSVPDSWNVPNSLYLGEKQFYIDLDGYHTSFSNRYILFSFPVDSGAHVLDVNYEALTAEYFYPDITTNHGFLYMLSPAKDWKEYHHLHLNIQVPTGWVLESNLEYNNSGDEYSGDWKRLPADYLFMVTREKDSFGYFFYDGYLLLSLAILVFFMVIWMRKNIRSMLKGEYGQGFTWSFPLWAVLPFLFIGYFLFFSLPGFMSWIYGKELSVGIGRGDVYTIMAFPFFWFLAVGFCYIGQAILYYFISEKQRKSRQ